MEQHPVPRNISGFQFHLVGDMTLKQFAYLAFGLFAAFLIYKIAPFPLVINLFFAAIAGLAGVAFAFFPIQDRPLDRWLIAFIKSVFAPTQYRWQKEGSPLEILNRPSVVHLEAKRVSVNQIQTHQEAKDKLTRYLASLPTHPQEALDNTEKQYIQKTMAMFGSVNPSPSPVSFPAPSPAVLPVANNTPTVSNPPPPSPVSPQLAVQPIPVSPPPHEEIKGQLTKLTAEKDLLEKELTQLQQQLQKTKGELIKPNPAPTATAEPSIKTVAPKMARAEIGLPNFPQIPNLIMGVIKDPQRKFLPNIILTIKDKNGLPLRALKTNKVGQFVTATPLSNGTYLIEIEDPLKRFIFDTAEITLSGQTFPPIEIIAKGEKELTREKLTKELFGNTI